MGFALFQDPRREWNAPRLLRKKPEGLGEGTLSFGHPQPPIIHRARPAVGLGDVGLRDPSVIANYIQTAMPQYLVQGEEIAAPSQMSNGHGEV